jgi:chaperonin GroEL
MNKKVIIGDQCRDEMKNGIDILANAVKCTLGPRGRHAAIERKSGPPIITKDGVTVARYINLEDRVQNMGAQLIKSVAGDANNEAGDGTTTATVLAQEIYGRGLDFVKEGYNPVLIKRGIDLATEIVVKELKNISQKVNDERSLCQVATISANNDSHLGKMIAEAISTVGDNGIVSVEEATGNVTEVHYVEGLKLDKGWLHDAFVNNSSKNSCDMENPYILVCDDNIKSVRQLIDIINKIIESGQPFFLIVKNIEQEALSHLVLNQLNQVIRCCVIRAPGFGDYQRAVLEDVALLTGAKLFNSATMDFLKQADLSVLGRARQVSVGMNSTRILEGVSKPGVIESAVTYLSEQLLQDNIFDEQKAIIQDRISRLSGGAAIFKIGATSEGELREKKDRVEDAINAVKSAIQEGVVPGGGVALLRCLPVLENYDSSSLTKEETIGFKIIKESLKAPFSQILKNAGLDAEEMMQLIISNKNNFYGYDALRLELVDDMLERGIVDPTKVVRSALEHASSASGILLTTEVLICELVDNKVNC